MGVIVSLWKGCMCFANAALAAANLRDNFNIQPLIKEHRSAWMASSKVPGGCGKGPGRKCGLNPRSIQPQWMGNKDFNDSGSFFVQWMWGWLWSGSDQFWQLYIKADVALCKIELLLVEKLT